MSHIERSLPDMAVVDITLQGTSGLEWIKTLKTRRIHLPVLVLSRFSNRRWRHRTIPGFQSAAG